MFVLKPFKKKNHLWNSVPKLLLLTVSIGFIGYTPVIAQDQTSRENSSVLKAYPCPVGIMDITVQRLKDQYKGRSEVRITSNARTAQILVYAPAGVQSTNCREHF